MNARTIVVTIAVLLLGSGTAMAQAGSLDPTFNPGDVGLANGTDFGVEAVTLLPDGRILISGGFTRYNGEPCGHIVRLNADGSLDSSFNLDEGMDGSSGTMVAQPDGKILIVNVTNAGIARLDSDGSVDTSFDPGTGADATVTSVALQPNGKILISGYFTSFDGTARNRIARLNPDGSLDPSFNPGVGADSWVNSLALQPDGKILIGGPFDAYDGVPRSCIARLNSDGGLDTAFDPGSGAELINGGPSVGSIVLQPDGKIIIAGGFDSYNSTACAHLARLNADGSIDPGFASGTADIAATIFLVQPDGRLLVKRDDIVARLNPDGTLDNSFEFHLDYDHMVTDIVLQPDGRVLIAGGFDRVNYSIRSGIARLNTDGSTDIGFNPSSGANDEVTSIVVQPDGRILIGGWFTGYNDTARKHIARLNADGSLDTAFNPGTGPDHSMQVSSVNAIAVQPDGKLIVGGRFDSYDGVPCTGIVRLNTDGSMDMEFVATLENAEAVRSIALLPDGRILAGFSSMLVSDYIARLNQDGSPDASFVPGDLVVWMPHSGVSAIALQSDGKILIGGEFISFGGIARQGLARLNADGSLDMAFDPGLGVEQAIRSIVALADGGILIGGGFDTYDGTERRGIARLMPSGDLDTDFGTFGVDGVWDRFVNAIAVRPDGKIIIGGYFTAYDNVLQNSLVRLNPDGSLDPGFDPGSGPLNINQAFQHSISSISVQPDGRILIGGAFTSYNGIGRNRIARLMGDEVFDCEGVLGGPALPGTPCDDGCALNGSEVWDPQCVCTGQALTGMVELTPFDTLCPGGDPYPLAHAVPAGGTWSGMNVADNAFQAGPQLGGDAELSYTVTDPNTGCTLTATQPIAWIAPQVSSVDGPLISGPFGGGCGYDPLQLVAVPAGGTWAYPADDGGVLDRSCEARPFTIDESVYTLHAANGDCPAVHLAFVENWIEYRPCAEPIDAGPDISVCTDGGQLEWTGFYYHNPGSPYSSQDTHTDCDSSYWEADTHHCLFFPEQHEAGIYPIVRISVNTAYCGIAYDTLIVTIAEPSLWYLDADGDGLGDANDTVTACGQPEGHVAISTDCDDADASITAPGDPCDDGNANTGNDVLTEGCVCLGTPVDSDGDGVPDDTDCAPNDPNVQVLNAGSNGTCEVCAANAAYDLFGCLGGSPQPGGTWYTLPGDTVVSASFDASAYGPGVWQFWYVLDATANCPADSAVAIVMVTAAPDAGEDASVAVCSDGIPIDLFSVLNGTPDAGGAWSLNGTAHSNFYNPTSDAPGAYTYVSTGTSPCANDTATVTVAEPQAPDPGISGVVTLCSNGVAVELLDFVNGGPDSTGTWSFNGTAHSGIFVPGTDAPGVYWYSVEGVEPCFDNSASMLVTVVLAPNSGEDSSILICGTDAPFSLFGALPDNPDVGGTWFLDGQMTGPFFDPGTYEEGTYTCLYVVSGNVPCPGDTATLTVTLMEADIIPITIIGPDPVLTQDPVTYTADPALDSVVWTLPDGWAWSPDDTDTTDATAILIPSTQGGPFTISAQGFGSGCESGTYTFAGNSSVGMAAGNSPADGMLVYPNPAHGHLTARWDGNALLRFALYNALGQPVLDLGQHASGAVLDLGGIAPGVYTLRWKGAEKDGRTSVVVQH